MSDASSKNESLSKAELKAKEKQERMAAKLRENLRRRKEQTRERKSNSTTTPE